MTSILFKIFLIGTLFSGFLLVLANLPEAQPLPSLVTDGIDWLVSIMYYFNDILPVPTFFLIVYYMCNVYFTFVALLILKTAINWTLRVA